MSSSNKGISKKKCYDFDKVMIIFVHDVNDKTLLCDSNEIIDVGIWPKFGISSISMKKVIINSILQEFD